jgi:hypothetical protein
MFITQKELLYSGNKKNSLHLEESDSAIVPNKE